MNWKLTQDIYTDDPLENVKLEYLACVTYIPFFLMTLLMLKKCRKRYLIVKKVDAIFHYWFCKSW